jgi:hypothetical protein
MYGIVPFLLLVFVGTNPTFGGNKGYASNNRYFIIYVHTLLSKQSRVGASADRVCFFVGTTFFAPKRMWYLRHAKKV